MSSSQGKTGKTKPQAPARAAESVRDPGAGHSGDSGLARSGQDFRHLNTRNRAKNKELQMEIVIIGVELLRRWLPRLGPYVLVEIALPGGTLLALLLYLYRRKNSSIREVLPLRAAMASSPILAKT